MKYWWIVLCVVALMGCSIQSKKEAAVTPEGTAPLEVPPDLVLPETDHSMDIPPVKADSMVK